MGFSWEYAMVRKKVRPWLLCAARIPRISSSKRPGAPARLKICPKNEIPNVLHRLHEPAIANADCAMTTYSQPAEPFSPRLHEPAIANANLFAIATYPQPAAPGLVGARPRVHAPHAPLTRILHEARPRREIIPIPDRNEAHDCTMMWTRWKRQAQAAPADATYCFHRLRAR